MDYQTNEKKKVPSVLQSDEMFSSKILSRQSTVGSCSSRMFYRGAEGVPFQWETQPGKSITPPSDDTLPPLSPPPAVLAMSLPKPCIKIMDEPKARRWSSAWLLKKIKKRMEGHRSLGGSKRICNVGQQPIFESDRYHYESARFSTSSFASTSTSSSNISFNDKPSSNVNTSSTIKGLLQGRPFKCSTKGLSNIVVYFAKRA